MEKLYLTYEDLNQYADMVARYLRSLHKPLNLIAITRGGLALAQLVAYKLALPLSFFYPYVSMPEADGPLIVGPVDFMEVENVYVFLEDVVAQGRTYNIVNEFMDMPDINWLFIPVVFDAKLNPADFPHIPTDLIWSPEKWVVFPHEDAEQVRAGDRGLFREGSSENSKAIV